MGNCLLICFYLFRYWKHLIGISIKYIGLTHIFSACPPKMRIFSPPHTQDQVSACDYNLCVHQNTITLNIHVLYLCVRIYVSVGVCIGVCTWVCMCVFVWVWYTQQECPVEQPNNLAISSRRSPLSCRRFAGDLNMERSGGVAQLSAAATRSVLRCTCYCCLGTSETAATNYLDPVHGDTLWQHFGDNADIRTSSHNSC